MVVPQPLPESWLAAAAAAGQTLATTADLDVIAAAGIVEMAPQLVADLEPAQWRALSPEVAAILLPELTEPDPVLLTQLTAIANAAAGVEPEPQPLPQEMIDAAAAAGQTLATTADITVESVELLATFAPEMLAMVPAELLYALAPAKLAALPADYLAMLDEGTQQTIANILVWDAVYQAELAMAEVEPEVAQVAAPVEPQPLPESWSDAAAATGQTLATTADVDGTVAAGIIEFAPQLVADLEPVQWLALSPDAAEVLLPALEEPDPVLLGSARGHRQCR